MLGRSALVSLRDEERRWPFRYVKVEKAAQCLYVYDIVVARKLYRHFGIGCEDCGWRSCADGETDDEFWSLQDAEWTCEREVFMQQEAG